MKINLLLRSLTDGSHNILPLDDVEAIDTPEMLKSKILHAYPPLGGDGDFFLAHNGVYFEEDGTGNVKIGQYGVEENSMVQVVRLQEILQQQREEQHEKLLAAQAAGDQQLVLQIQTEMAHNPLEAALAEQQQNQVHQPADLTALAAESLLSQSQQQQAYHLAQQEALQHSQNTLNATGTGKSGFPSSATSAAGGKGDAEALKRFKEYKNKSRKNKWKIRAELLPNDGGHTTVHVHDQEYDKLACLQHALLYDPEDSATWAALGACLQHPRSKVKEFSMPVTGGGEEEEERKEEQFNSTDCLTISLRLDPMNSHNWVALGACLSSDLSETVTLFERKMNRSDCFSRAAELDPMYPRAWYNLALNLLDSPNPSEAQVYVGSNAETVESCLLRVLQCDPRHAGAWVSLGLLLGYSYEGNDNDEVSMGEESYDRRGCLVQALKCDPKHARAWYNVGVSLPPSSIPVVMPEDRIVRLFDNEPFNRQACFERAVRYKPRAAHHWVALATEMSLTSRISSLDEHILGIEGAGAANVSLAKWDCFAKAIELDSKNAGAWCGIGQTLLTIQEQNAAQSQPVFSFPSESNNDQQQPQQHQIIELPTHYKGLATPLSSSAGNAVSALLMTPDTLSPKHCFELALHYRFNMSRAWMSLVYLLGKEVDKFIESNSTTTTPSSSSSPSASNSPTNMSKYKKALKQPQVKIGTREFNLKETATYAVEYNNKDARAWGNLASAMLQTHKALYILKWHERRQEQITRQTGGVGASTLSSSASAASGGLGASGMGRSTGSFPNTSSSAALDDLAGGGGGGGEDEEPIEIPEVLVSISDPNDPEVGEQTYNRMSVLQMAIVLAEESLASSTAGTTLAHIDKWRKYIGKWWFELAMCMTDPGSGGSESSSSSSSSSHLVGPDRLLIRNQSMTKYDCIDKALEFDEAIGEGWFELANYWSKRIRNERVASDKVFRDYTTLDLILRSISMNSKNAFAWMNLSEGIKNVDLNDDDDTELEVEGQRFSYRLSVQRALECDRHLARGWLELSKTFRGKEQHVLVAGTLVTRAQCIIRALEENDRLPGAIPKGELATQGDDITTTSRSSHTQEGGGVPGEEEEDAEEAQEEEERRQQQRMKMLQIQQQQQELKARMTLPGQIQSMIEDPFDDDELFAMWNDLGHELLKKQQVETETRNKTGSMFQGKFDVGQVIAYSAYETAVAAAQGSAAALAAASGKKSNSTSKRNQQSSFLLLQQQQVQQPPPSSFSKEVLAASVKEISASIKWKSTPKQPEIFFAENCFQKALSIFNTSAPAWHGLARALETPERLTVVDGGKWNQQSCLEKALTFDPSQKDAWVELGQILPDDSRTGCAYISMERYGRQQCYERALDLDSSGDSSLWCLLGSCLGRGVTTQIKTDFYDESKCYFKALAIDEKCSLAWMSMGFMCGEDGSVEVPRDPAMSLSTEDEEVEEEQVVTVTEEVEKKKPESASPPPGSPRPGTLSPSGSGFLLPPKVVAVEKETITTTKTIKKKVKKKTTITFTGAECFERALEIKAEKEKAEAEKAMERAANSSKSNFEGLPTYTGGGNLSRRSSFQESKGANLSRRSSFQEPTRTGSASTASRPLSRRASFQDVK